MKLNEELIRLNELAGTDEDESIKEYKLFKCPECNFPITTGHRLVYVFNEAAAGKHVINCPFCQKQIDITPVVKNIDKYGSTTGTGGEAPYFDPKVAVKEFEDAMKDIKGKDINKIAKDIGSIMAQDKKGLMQKLGLIAGTRSQTDPDYKAQVFDKLIDIEKNKWGGLSGLIKSFKPSFKQDKENFFNGLLSFPKEKKAQIIDAIEANKEEIKQRGEQDWKVAAGAKQQPQQQQAQKTSFATPEVNPYTGEKTELVTK